MHLSTGYPELFHRPQRGYAHAMELVPLLINVISACVAVGAVVVMMIFMRRGADAELKGDVDELSRLMEKMAREQRRERMRQVRAGEKAGGSDSQETISTPFGPRPVSDVAPAESDDPQGRKAALRRRLRGSA